MDTLIGAGGSGTRVLEAVLHLCAIGLGPPQLRIFIIDPDATNGSIATTRDLVSKYQELHNDFADGPYFKTRLELLQGGDATRLLQVWSPVKENEKFRKVLNWERLSDQEREIVDLLFTGKELDMNMKVGFRGHPALGAAALSLLPLYQNDPAKTPLWAELKSALNNEVTHGTANVMIAGSVFGGTGAATLHPLVRHLRSSQFLESNTPNLKVGAVALVPYFQFDKNAQRAAPVAEDDEDAARSQNFPLACRSAADYYSHLQNTNEWDFDAMYWLGDDSPASVPYSKGGSTQKNPAHFVDLLGAMACMDFFSNVPKDRMCRYAGPQADTAQPGKNVLRWSDLPLNGTVFGQDLAGMRKAIHAFQMMAIAHLGFYNPLLQHPDLATKTHCVPWYVKRFTGPNESLTSIEAKAQLSRLTAYLVGSYLPWWRQIFSIEKHRVQLLNEAAWASGPHGVDLSRLGNLVDLDKPINDFEAVDLLFDLMVEAAADSPSGDNPPSVYLQMLHQAAGKLVAQLSANQA